MSALFSPAAPDPVPTPAPVPAAPDAEQAARQARLDALERRRRGLAGTIAGSAKGFLQVREGGTARKTLLGE